MEKKKTVKKLLSVSTAIAVMLTMPFALDLSVKAMQRPTPPVAEEHTHDSISWTKWENGSALPTTAGKYYLTTGVTLSETATITEDISICLNGQTIENKDHNGSVIKVGKNGKFSLYDCIGNGKITGGNSEKGGGVYVDEGGTFTMYGGTISGNTASGYGGGVYVNGKFIMENGTISGNTSNKGGGVIVGNGTFTMEDGTISSNIANDNGGGLFLNGTFTMKGGEISSNTAKEYSGVRINYGNIVIDGKVKITSNTLNDSKKTASNLFLPQQETITIGQNFNAASEVGVITGKSLNGCTDLIAISGEANKDVSVAFQSDNSSYHIVYSNNVINLAGRHTGDLTNTPEIPATPTETGVKAHWHCSVCNKDFQDERGIIEITDLTLPATGSQPTDPQTPDNPPQSDPNPTDSEETEPTEITPTDFFPNIDLDNVAQEVEQTENVPAARIAYPIEDLLKAIMPQEELEAIEGTDEIKIVLKVEDASETVSAEDKLQVEAVLQENESLVLCQYLDLTLLKILNSSESEITNTISPIPVIFEVPEEFKKANRDFVVIRVHGDEITLLNDLDKVTNTVTIKTDKFSTYALAYIDKDKIKDNDENNSNNNEDNNKDDNNNNEGNPNTGVYVSIIPFTLAAASLSALTIKKKSK